MSTALVIGEILVSGMINLAMQKVRVDGLITTARLENRDPTPAELAELDAARRQMMHDLDVSIKAAIIRANDDG